MNRLFLSTASAAVLLAGAAHAETTVDVGQVFLNVQDATNSIDVVHNNHGVAQDATNLGNGLIDERAGNAANYDDVNQIAIGAQNAANDVSSYYGMWTDLEQNATNVTNLVNVQDVNELVQITAAVQNADNFADYGQAVTDVGQSASNIANLAEVDDAKNHGDFILQLSLTGQDASNHLNFHGNPPPTHPASGASNVEGLTQEATNVANLLNADDVRNVIQGALLAQKATNTAEFGIGLTDGEQTATNVGNLINADEITNVAIQGAIGEQTAVNRAVTNASGNHHAGSINGLDQSASNLANVITAQDGLTGSAGFIPEAVQVSAVSQTARNVIDGNGGTGNLTQGATNVSNLVSITVDVE
ncbi:hypothetical protein [Inquilinus sp. CAU 1745]|uniref:hypothetical protein n=1 Tax=Inquilinus sp. CAU 1745 TaxID=3140369 RepID=UPI00325B5056